MLASIFKFLLCVHLGRLNTIENHISFFKNSSSSQY